MPKSVTLPPVRVEPETLEELRRISDESGISVYELTRQAVDTYIQDQRRKQRFLNSLAVATDGDHDHDQIGVIPS
jgi:hypothetical protein